MYTNVSFGLSVVVVVTETDAAAGCDCGEYHNNTKQKAKRKRTHNTFTVFIRIAATTKSVFFHKYILSTVGQCPTDKVSVDAIASVAATS